MTKTYSPATDPHATKLTLGELVDRATEFPVYRASVAVEFVLEEWCLLRAAARIDEDKVYLYTSAGTRTLPATTTAWAKVMG